MSRRWIVTTLLALSAHCAAAQDLPAGDTIMDHFIEVTGGKEAYEKIHNQVSKGKMEFSGKGVKGAIESYEAEPNREYSVADIEGLGKVESGSDGDVFWERSAIAGPRIKSGAEREEVMTASLFNPYLYWRKIYQKAEATGSETVEGEDCYKVLLTSKAGRPVTQYYSKKSGLLIKISSVHATQMGDIPADAFMKDYRPVSGVMTPFTRLNRFAGQEIALHLESIEFNADIPKDRFVLPEEIKALLRKNGATDDKK